jgi:hypothetical protein
MVPHIRLVPHLDIFPVIDQDLTTVLKFGRLVRAVASCGAVVHAACGRRLIGCGRGVRQPDASEAVEADFIGFNSKVVSRKHAEIWAQDNEFYIKDTRSQSGTFLNAMRLSLPGEESKPFKIKNGDAVQFGVDRRGADDDNMKCGTVAAGTGVGEGWACVRARADAMGSCFQWRSA